MDSVWIDDGIKENFWKVILLFIMMIEIIDSKDIFSKSFFKNFFDINGVFFYNWQLAALTDPSI